MDFIMPEGMLLDLVAIPTFANDLDPVPQSGSSAETSFFELSPGVFEPQTNSGGEPPTYQGPDMIYIGYRSSGSGGSNEGDGGGSGGGGTYEEENRMTPESELPPEPGIPAKDTPCLNELPAGVTKQQINNIAKAVAEDLISRSSADGFEWVSVVYRAANGQIGVSDPSTSRSSDGFNVTLIVPTGATVIAWVHTQPFDGQDQRLPSDADRNNTRNLIDRFNADPNLLIYVATNSDGGRLPSPWETYVYDRSNRDASRPSCTL